MVLIANRIGYRGNMIHANEVYDDEVYADDVAYVESKTRNYKYACHLCNKEVRFVNKHIRKYRRRKKYVHAHFRHIDSKNNDCEAAFTYATTGNTTYIAALIEYVNKWIDCVKPKYKNGRRIGNVIDIVNKKNDHIYAKYSLMSSKNIVNKCNDEGRIIWILSIDSKIAPTGSDFTKHPRPCCIYKVNSDRATHMIHFDNKADVFEFELTEKSKAFLDDGASIYELLDNDQDNTQTYFDEEKGKPIEGHHAVELNINDFINDVFGGIIKYIPDFGARFAYPKAYNREELAKIRLVESIWLAYDKYNNIKFDYPVTFHLRKLEIKPNRELSDILASINEEITIRETLKKDSEEAERRRIIESLRIEESIRLKEKHKKRKLKEEIQRKHIEEKIKRDKHEWEIRRKAIEEKIKRDNLEEELRNEKRKREELEDDLRRKKIDEGLEQWRSELEKRRCEEDACYLKQVEEECVRAAAYEREQYLRSARGRRINFR